MIMNEFSSWIYPGFGFGLGLIGALAFTTLIAVTVPIPFAVGRVLFKYLKLKKEIKNNSEKGVK